MKRHTVGDVMTREVVTIRETSGYKEVLEALATNALSAVPVVDDEGHVLGVVSEADLLHKIEFAGSDAHARLFERKRVRRAREKAGADIAKDLMSTPAVIVSAAVPVAVAAKMMDAERVKRLPVIDENLRLVGIVSRGDLLRLYLRDDESIRSEIIKEVLLRTLWIDPSDLTIEVERGIVTLDGELERHSQVPIVVQLVASVAGVVDVINKLTYRYDDIRHRATDETVPTVAGARIAG
jgi:CBS domain-containing protein